MVLQEIKGKCHENSATGPENLTAPSSQYWVSACSLQLVIFTERSLYLCCCLSSSYWFKVERLMVPPTHQSDLAFTGTLIPLGAIGKNLEFRTLPKDTSTCRQSRGLNDQPSDYWMTRILLSHIRSCYVGKYWFYF